MPPRRGAIVVVQELLRSLRVPTKEPALSNGADAAFETTDHSVRQKLKPALFDRVHVVVVPPVRRIAPVPTTGTLGQVCVDFCSATLFFLSPEKTTSLAARVSPIELQACGPVIEEQATAAFQRRTSALQLRWQGRHGNLVPYGAVRWRSTSAVARNDVMLRPVPEPHSPIWLVEAVGSAPVLAL